MKRNSKRPKAGPTQLQSTHFEIVVAALEEYKDSDEKSLLQQLNIPKTAKSIDKIRNVFTGYPHQQYICLWLIGKLAASKKSWAHRIRELAFQDCNLIKLPDTLKNLLHVKHIDLSRNKLTDISMVTACTKTIFFACNGNKLTTIPDGISAMSHLEILQADDNELMDLPDAIGDLPNLTTLSLRNNHLTLLTPAVGKTTALTTIHLNGNKIAKIPTWQNQLPNLRIFALGNNPLDSIPEEIKAIGVDTEQWLQHEIEIGHSNCSTLSLANCSLERFPKTIIGMNKLTEVDLTGNDFYAMEFPPDFQILPDNLVVQLGPSPLSETPQKLCNFFIKLFMKQTTMFSLLQSKDNKKHAREVSLLQSPKFDTGFWLAKLEQDLLTEDFDEKLAEIYVISLVKSEVNWPWKNRKLAITKKQADRWLTALTTLNSHYPILAEIHPDLMYWLGDLFNYIPRNFWNKVSRLIPSLIKNGRFIKDDLHLPQCFSDNYHSSLNALCPIGTAIKTPNFPKDELTSKKLFRSIGSRVEGIESHSHRHGLYLLWWSALYNQQLRPDMFCQSGQLNPLFLRIQNPSCLAVLWTALLDSYLFPGHRYNQSPNPLLEELTKGVSAQPPLLNLSNWHTPALTNGQKDAIEAAFHRNLLKKSFLQINGFDAQLQEVLHGSLQRQKSNGDLYSAVADWIGDTNDLHFGKHRYDSLAMWLQRRTNLKNNIVENRLERRYQQLLQMSATQIRKTLISAIENLFSKKKFTCLTADERKQYFFDYWYLINLKETFEDPEFSLVNLFNIVPEMILNRGQIELCEECLAETKDEVFFGKLILLLNLVEIESNKKSRKTELNNLFREDIISPLFWRQQQSKTKMATLVKNLIGNAKFKGYFTPMALQMYFAIQNIAARSTKAAKKNTKTTTHATEQFKYFWELFIHNPEHTFYEKLGKMFDTGYHLFNTPKPKPDIDWNEICRQFEKLDKARDKILVETQQTFGNWGDQPSILDTLRESIIPSIEKYTQIFADINTLYAGKLIDLAYPTNALRQMMTQLQNKGSALFLADYETQTLSFIQHNTDAMKHLIKWQTSHGMTLLTERDVDTVDTLSNFHQSLNQNNTEQASMLLQQLRQTCRPENRYKHLPWPELVVWNLSIQFALLDSQRILTIEQQFDKNDADLHSANYQFAKSTVVFSKAQDRTTTRKYWKHLQDKQGIGVVERKVLDGWIEFASNKNYQIDKTVTSAQKQRIKAKHMLDEKDKLLFPPEVDRFVIALTVERNKDILKQTYRPLMQKVLRNNSLRPSVESQQKAEHDSDEEIPKHHAALLTSFKSNTMYDLAAMIPGQSDVRSYFGHRIKDFVNTFVGSVIALTLLLDFGGDLVKIIDHGTSWYVFIVPFLVVTATISHFYTMHVKLRKYGYELMQTIKNLSHSYASLILFAGFFTHVWLWTGEDLHVSLKNFFKHFSIMLFFSEIIVATTRGVFNTDHGD